MTAPAPPSDTAIEAKIRTDYEAMFVKLTGIDAPDGHRWLKHPGALTWCYGDILASTKRIGPSIYLQHCGDDAYDVSQLHVEVRLTWNDQPGERPKLDIIRCILWCEMGSRIGFEATSLLTTAAAHLRAEDVDQLYVQISTHLEPALTEYRRHIAARYRPS